MISANYINVSGGKLVRTKDDNYIKLFQVNTISSIVADRVDIYAFKIWNHTGTTFAFQDYLLTVKTSGGISSCSIYNLGNERSTDIFMKVLKEDETYTVCGRGYNSWQDITCQILYTTNPSSVDYLFEDDYILTSTLSDGTIFEPSDSTYSFTVNTEAKIFIDTASYHNRVDKVFDYAIVNLGLYTQDDTSITNGTLIGTLPFKPYNRPLISSMVYYSIDSSVGESGVCPIEISSAGAITAKATIPASCRLGINLCFKIK